MNPRLEFKLLMGHQSRPQSHVCIDDGFCPVHGNDCLNNGYICSFAMQDDETSEPTHGFKWLGFSALGTSALVFCWDAVLHGAQIPMLTFFALLIGLWSLALDCLIHRITPYAIFNAASASLYTIGGICNGAFLL